MKLIMTHEVDGLGVPGDVVEVRDGYGRNYLLPRGFAVKWTAGGQRQVDTLRRGRQARQVRNLDDAEAAASRLRDMRVVMRRRAGDNGRLFGSVTAKDIATAITDAGGPQVDSRRIDVRQPIKTLGDYQLRVRLHDEVIAQVRLRIASE